MRVLKAPVFKPFSGILRKIGKTKEAVKNCLKMVRVTGLEPVRQRHTPLKRACLPIPAHSHFEQSNYSIIFMTCQYLFFKKHLFFEKMNANYCHNMLEEN